MDELVKCLNEFLSDLNVYYRKLQNYHWNIKGKEFFVMHAKLEEYYDELNEQIDEIAEHILILGYQPLGRMKDYLETSKIQEAENTKVGTDVVFKGLIEGYNTLEQKVKDIKSKADTLNCYSTSALMDEYISDYSKKLWMLSQSQ